ncbi:hypothetical protein CDIK_2630 [Cucumispora dikerogammari]|nr:hypothetical protein CDIK_2630 [Cucumispora dikerogammari]
MFNQIIYALNSCLCKEEELPEISKEPFILHSAADKTEQSKNTIGISEHSEAIAIIVNLKNRFGSDIIDLTKLDLNCTLHVRFVEMYKGNDKQFFYTRNSKFTFQLPKEIIDLNKLTTQESGKNMFMFSIVSKYENSKNSLIEYLKNNPYKAFSAYIFFYNNYYLNTQNTIVSKFKEFDNDIDNFLKPILEKLKNISTDLNKRKSVNCQSESTIDKNTFQVFQENISSVKMALNDPKYISNEIKTAIERCLRIFEKVLNTLNKTGYTESEIKTVFEEKMTCLLDLFSEIKTYYQEELSRITNKSEIEDSYKNKIILSLKDVLNNYDIKRFEILQILSDLSRYSTFKAVFPVFLDTKFFRFDSDTSQLKQVNFKETLNIHKQDNVIEPTLRTGIVSTQSQTKAQVKSKNLEQAQDTSTVQCTDPSRVTVSSRPRAVSQDTSLLQDTSSSQKTNTGSRQTSSITTPRPHSKILTDIDRSSKQATSKLGLFRQSKFTCMLISLLVCSIFLNYGLIIYFYVIISKP